MRASEKNIASTNVDVLVVGSGAGGLTAALAAHARGLSVLVVEKAPKFGGSTALSGGGIWAPGANALKRDGYSGSFEEELEYMRALTKGSVGEELLRAYLRNIAGAIDFLEGLGPRLPFSWKPGYPDYFPELPGGSAIGRSINVKPIDLRELGPDLDHLLQVPGIAGFWLTSSELRTLYTLRQSWGGKVVFGKILWRIVKARLSGERISTLGPALAARLFLALRDAGVPVWLDTALIDILLDEEGAVQGGTVVRDGHELQVRAGSVILASGGFDHDLVTRRREQPELSGDWSLGTPYDTGDGLAIGTRLGAATAALDSAWWFPVIDWPEGRGQFLLNERMIPGQFIVNGAGKRYVNEAVPYTEFGRAMIAGERESKVSHIPSWLVMDARAWRSYVVAGHLPMPRIPFAPVPTGRAIPRKWLDSGAVHQAGTLVELGRAIGVDPEALQSTADRFNRDAATGVDNDFHRGESAYDNYYGDARLPNPNLAPVTRAPFYAFRIVPGDLGTNGGLVTDEHGRVLREAGDHIAGLYAAGNVTASVMGPSYAGPGATIGPAIAFGFAAANHIAKSAREL